MYIRLFLSNPVSLFFVFHFLFVDFASGDFFVVGYLKSQFVFVGFFLSCIFVVPVAVTAVWTETIIVAHNIYAGFRVDERTSNVIIVLLLFVFPPPLPLCCNNRVQQ